MQPHAEQPVWMGDGDSVNSTGASLAQFFEFAQGTAGSPDTTPNPVVKISRTVSLLQSQITGDGTDWSSTLVAGSVVASSSEVQGVGVFGFAQTFSTKVTASGSADGVGGYFFGRVMGSGIHTGTGLYSEGRRDTATGRANGAEIRVTNETATAGTYNASGFSDTTGLWLTAGGTAQPAVAAAVGYIASQASPWRTGFAVTQGSVTDQAFRDDSNATTSFLINGTHTGGAVVVASGSGSIIVGHTSLTNASALLELFATATTDPLFAIQGSGNVGVTAKIGNSSGSGRLFAVGTAGTFVPGSAVGDIGIASGTSGKRILLGSSTALVVSVTNAGGVGFFGVAEATQQTGGAKTAAATYGTNEQTMLQTIYNMGRTFGFLN